GYDFGFKWLPFTIGCFYTVAWIAVLIRLRRNPARPIIAWAAGITVMWGMLAVLFVGWADNAKSYRGTFVQMQQALARNYSCSYSRELGMSQRASLEYFTGIVTEREESAGRKRRCELLLVQGGPVEDTVMGGTWKKIWEGHRPGDGNERYRLYQRLRR